MSRALTTTKEFTGHPCPGTHASVSIPIFGLHLTAAMSELKALDVSQIHSAAVNLLLKCEMGYCFHFFSLFFSLFQIPIDTSIYFKIIAV